MSGYQLWLALMVTLTAAFIVAMAPVLIGVVQ